MYSSDSAVRLYLYAFHMPLFFLISGVFHKNNGRINWNHYLKTILWPTAIFIILNILVSSLLWGGFIRQLRQFFIQLPLGKYSGIFWFLLALFWCKVLTDIVIRYRTPVLTLILWGISLFIPVLLNKRLPFGMTQGLMAFPFYWVGVSFKGVLSKLKPSLFWIVLAFSCLAATVFITQLHGRVSMSDVVFGHLSQVFNIQTDRLFVKLACFTGDVAIFYLNGIIGSIMILSFALLPFPKIPAMSAIAKSLITVIGTQYLFITPVIKYWGLNQPFWISASLSICIFALCFLSHLLLRHVYKWVQ